MTDNVFRYLSFLLEEQCFTLLEPLPSKGNTKVVAPHSTIWGLPKYLTLQEDGKKVPRK